MKQIDLFENEFDRMYGDSYREGNSAATNSAHQLPSNAAADTEDGQSLTTENAAKQLATQLKPKDLDKEKYLVFGYDPMDFVNVLYPNGPNCRHDAARNLFNDFIVLYDGDWELGRDVLLKIQFVQDLITERGMDEIERIIEGGRKLFQKRESENYTSLQPSRPMRRPSRR